MSIIANVVFTETNDATITVSLDTVQIPSKMKTKMKRKSQNSNGSTTVDINRHEK